LEVSKGYFWGRKIIWGKLLLFLIRRIWKGFFWGIFLRVGIIGLEVSKDWGKGLKGGLGRKLF